MAATHPAADDVLTGQIIGLAMEVHRTLGPGFLESVYRRALLIELHRAGIRADPEQRIAVRYRGEVVGEFIPDLVVEQRLIVELKAVQNLDKAHEVQTVNYLTATGLETGLLINFGSRSLQFKRKFRLPTKPAGAANSL
jgi:GxxExxY protein